MYDLSDRMPAGTPIGRYLIGEWISTGGTADVYTCRLDDGSEEQSDPNLHRYVAKVFRHDGEPEQYERRRRLFEHEARVLENLSGNIHVVSVFEKGYLSRDSEKDPLRPYTILQRLCGGTLGDLICERPYSEEEAVRIAIGLVDALKFAHDRGILHCDVKPDNVMLDDSNNPVWIDFGIAKEYEAPADKVSIISEKGSVAVGTAPYMSPEHFLGRHSLCPQSDLWSMGVLLMRMLTRDYPFGLHFEQVRQRTLIQMWKRFRDLPLYKSSKELPDLSPAMRAIIVKCLQVELVNRYQDAGHLKSDLEEMLRGRPLVYADISLEEEPVTAGAPDPPAAVSPRPRDDGMSLKEGDHTHSGRRRKIVLAAGVGAAVVIGTLIGLPSLLRTSSVPESEVVSGLPLEWRQEVTTPPPDTVFISQIPTNLFIPRINPPEEAIPDVDDEEFQLEDQPGEDDLDPEGEDAQPIASAIEGAGIPVSVMLFPNRGYREEHSQVNGETVQAGVGLIKRFEGRVGQEFAWEIMGTDGRVHRRSVMIPSEARNQRLVRINWQTGEIEYP